MKYYPAFIRLAGERVVFSGAGDHAAAKIRLLLKTEADIHVFGSEPSNTVRGWADENRLTLHERDLAACDVLGAKLVYGANDEPEADARALAFARKAGVLGNIVDNLEASDFLTPAMVDRDPVVVAIGTEGTAPVLARTIKAQVEEMLPTSTGPLARLADGFRATAAKLGSSAKRRAFWHRFFTENGPKALADSGEGAVEEALRQLFDEAANDAPRSGRVDLVGTGPGDQDLLTLKARKTIASADIVLHDRLVTPEILELARREATIIETGKKGYGEAWAQDDINALMIEHAREGRTVARLKSGDPSIYGRLDEELDALDAAGIDWAIIPGITTASAAAASIGASLTRRGRNSSLRFLTGRDVDGFADQDWAALARPSATAAIYMGIKAGTFLAGRLLMHGADPETPVTIIENVSRANQRNLPTRLGGLPATLAHEDVTGPAILMLGLEPRCCTRFDFSSDELDALTGTGG